MRGSGSQFIALLIFLIFVAILVSIWSADTGVPVTGGILPQPPNLLDPSNFDIRATEAENRAAQERARGSEALNQANLVRTLQAETQAAWEADNARQTQEMVRQTAMVVESQTQAAWQVTVEAGKTRDAREAVITETAQYWNNYHQQETADFSRKQGEMTDLELAKAVRDDQNNAQWDNLKLQAAANTAWFWANWTLWVYLLVCAVVIGATFAGVYYVITHQRIKAKKASVITVPANPAGVHDAVWNDGVVTNVDQMASEKVDMRQAALQSSLEAQNEVAKMNQVVRGAMALARGGLRRQAIETADGLARQVAAGTPGFSAPSDPAEWPTDPAPWDLTQWGGKTLPLGVGLDNAGIELDPSCTPNLVVASTSGGGKTMRALRPLAAEALAANWYVVTANIKGGDFAPFRGQANLTDVNGQAGDVADLLEAVLGEVERRNQVMKDLGLSTYYRIHNAEQFIGPRLMIMIDEIVSLIYGADKATVNRIWKASINIASKCRSMGVMLVVAGTDITYRLGHDWLALRANCGRMAFHMMDRDMSHALLDAGGAENLQGAQFIARLDGDPVRGLAFQPEDADIQRFLTARQIRALPAPVFLGPKTVPLKEEPSREQRVRELAAQGMSMNAIQQTVFGFTGGQAFTFVKSVLASTTTTELPGDGPVPAEP